ncbi:flippase [Vreelandella aquamarina]|uniref:flippase n=1 Tax=Halomonadaceae TaxID=28256 RepID=UPI0005CC64D6|nr:MULTISPECIES: flippase [Halomonas]KJD18159.1 hypothetical protein VE30_14660 [Halomonas meridiana]MCF2913997.1 flippase [Halomonas sp. Cn5-12]MCO7244518.1 flippase [Halomonas sp. Ps84H-12]MCP1304072.1 flippase [Halomonas sp. R1t8]MCP1330854.1 flippase [Halomonas sp. R1t4]|tara:strand:+ start:1352 stop:2638 length:1287 start_codon:yes stop_codon:yes gene_type:complete
MSRRLSIKSVSFLWLGSFAGAGLAFLSQVLLARLLNPELFGLFGAGLALAMLLTPIASFGIGQYWLKAFGEEGWHGVRWVRPSIKLVIFSTAVAMAMLLMWAILGPNTTAGQTLLIFLSFHIAGQVAIELVSSKLQLEERFGVLALWQFSPHLLRFLLILATVFIVSSFNSFWVGWVYGITAATVVLFAVFFIKQMTTHRFLLRGHPAVQDGSAQEKVGVVDVAKQAWPFGLAVLAYLIYFQSDLALVKYMVGDAEAGFYNVAFTIMTAVYLFPSVLFQKFFLPKIHRWAHQDREKLRQVYLAGNKWMLVIGIAVAVVLAALAEPVVHLLFGETYIVSANYVKIFCLSIPAMFLAFCSGAMLVTKEHMKVKVRFMLWVAGFNIGLNIILIPIYGALAAALTTVASQYLLAVLYHYGASQRVFSEKWKQ